MTFEQYAHQELQANGLFDDQATEIVANAKGHKLLADLNGRWNDDVGGYPPVIKNIFWVSLKRVTLEYIEAKCPLAWFRPVFE
jgi:hypothetical protein